MPKVHQSAVAGYSAKAETYVKGRPEYPAAVDEWLRSDLGLENGKTVLDLGAGTGKFSKKLLATGATVFALDAVPAMLEQLRRQLPGVEAKLGSAESIPFADDCFDAVVCAQSFHWFATPETVAEVRRVLKPGGVWGLIWNVRDESVEWVAALTKIIAPYQGDTPRYHTQTWRQVFPAEGFSPLREQRFKHGHTGAPEQVIVSRTLSTSFIAALPADKQESIAHQVRELIAASPELAGRSQVTYPYMTSAFSCTKL